jgi:hypothetical protein
VVRESATVVARTEGMPRPAKPARQTKHAPDLRQAGIYQPVGFGELQLQVKRREHAGVAAIPFARATTATPPGRTG